MEPREIDGRRLLDLELELEDRLARRGPDHPVRDAMAIVRGLIELTLLYNAPLDVPRIEHWFAAIVEVVGVDDEKFKRDFLVRMRATAAWMKLTPDSVSLFATSNEERKSDIPAPRKPRAAPVRRKWQRRGTGLIPFEGRFVTPQWFRRYARPAA